MDFENNFNLHSNSNLNRLAKYLNFHISTTALYLLSFITALFLIIAVIASIIFAPFMLYVLHKENKKGWIIFFIIWVIVPLISLIILSIFHPIFKILILISLALFYIYCFLLRFEVNDWVEEERARNQLMLERMEEGKNKL